jgi:epoxyqueuosine reductase
VRPGHTLQDLVAGATGALVVGDGGGEFFARFRAARAPGPDPLDRYTARVIDALVAAVAPGARAFYPFTPPWLPMQTLGVAAGLPSAGPLGLQIHPRWGPWWAYRALIVLTDAPVTSEPPLARACDGCPAPCIAACPVGAPTMGGFTGATCARHRQADQACQHSCAARRACVVAPGAAYPAEQIAFHMDASLVMIRSRG